MQVLSFCFFDFKFLLLNIYKINLTGLPNALGGYDETAEDMASEIFSFAKDGLVCHFAGNFCNK